MGCACDGRIHCACSRCAAKHCVAVIQLAYFYESQGMKKIYPDMLHIYISCKLFSANVTELLFISSSFHYSFSVIVLLSCSYSPHLLTYTHVLMQFIHQTSKKTHTQTPIQWSTSMTPLRIPESSAQVSGMKLFRVH